MMILFRSMHGNIGTVDFQPRLSEQFPAFALIVDCNLLAEFEADFRLVPGCYLDTAIVFRLDGQRLIGNGLGFFIAYIGAIVIVSYAEMIAAVVAGGIIIHNDG